MDFQLSSQTGAMGLCSEPAWLPELAEEKIIIAGPGCGRQHGNTQQGGGRARRSVHSF